MHIREVNTAVKIGEFILKNNGPNKIGIRYLPEISEEFLTDDSARVYLFVQDGLIKKIGGSVQRGGIKATLSFYTNAMQGSPGRPRFIIHHLIAEALKKGSRVEVYIITSPKVPAKVNGLFGPIDMEIASYVEMESICKEQYYKKEGRYPDWNFKENGDSYPKAIEELYLEYHKKRIKNKS